MINIYLIIILCGLLLANAGFFCEHHGATHQAGLLTVTAKQPGPEKEKLAKLEKRLEQLAQKLTGISKTVNKLSDILARHHNNRQSSLQHKTDEQLKLTSSINTSKVFTPQNQATFITNTSTRSFLQKVPEK